MKFKYRAGLLLLLFIGILFTLSACNLGAPSNTDENEATLTTESELTAQPTTTELAQGGVTVFPTFTPFQFSTRPPNPTAIVIIPNNPPPPTNTPAPISIVIVAPLPGNIVSGTVQVVGSASHPNFLQYRLEYAPQNNPNNQWLPITGIVQQPTVAGVLGVWSTNTGTTPDGVYQLRLRVFLRDGTQQTTQVGNVRVQNQIATPVPTNTTTPRPIAAFTQNLTTGTAPLVVNFTSQSQGAITGHSWSFGDGGSSSNLNPIYTYRTPGTYTVTLRVNGPGGTSNVSRQITVNSPAAPVAAFDVSTISGEPPLTVDFTNNSTGQVNTTEWDFGDGTTSAEQSPTHIFNDPGTYNVILTVAGNGGSSSLIRQITVEDNTIEAPSASFEASATAIETGETISFSNTTTGESTSFLWDFNGDGITDNTDISPTHTYNTAGTYDVRLTAIGAGGQSDAVVSITVSDPPDAPSASFDVSVDNSIAPVVATFSNTSTGDATAYAWDFGDGRTSADENPQITYETAGTYLVTLTATGPGGSTTTEAVAINVETPLDPPVADFTADTQAGPVELTVNFSNASNGGQLSYTWDFGDGSPVSNEESPTHVYTTTGSFTVTLTVTDPQNQSDSATMQIDVSEVVVIAPPVPAFIFAPATGTVNENITFTNQTGGDVDSYAWDFGDGTSSAEANPVHAYSTAGTYTVTLTATNAGGSQTATQDILVNDVIPAPEPGFSVSSNPAEIDQVITFTNDSLNADSYSWDFGDGASSTDVNPTHAYSAAGTYTVSLSATGAGGTSSATQQIIINDIAVPLPVAGFSVDVSSGTVPLTVNFTDTSTDADAHSWDFNGDGVEDATGPGPHQFVYDVAGLYNASLTVSNASGSSAPFTQQIDAQAVAVPLPVAGFSVDVSSGTVPLTVNFTDTSTDADTHSWDFNGDGVEDATGAGPHQFVYDVANLYTASLTVSNASGSSAPFTQQIDAQAIAVPLPVAGFSVDVSSGTVPLTVNFTDTSTDADTHSWDFNGDGVEDATGPGPHQFVYDVAGLYNASLTVSNASGSSAPFTQQIDAQAVAVPLPVAGFSVDVSSGTVPLTVNFTDTSTDADTHSWDFNGDGVEDATGPGPHQFVYDVANLYTASLTVSNASGSSAPFTQQIDAQAIAVPLPVAGFSVDVSSGTVPLTVNFTDTSTDADTHSWDFNGDGVEDATGPGPHQFVYDVAGLYNASLTVSNASGSSAPFTQQIDAQAVAVPLPVAGFSVDVQSGTVPLTVNFTDTSTDADAHSWDFNGDGVEDATGAGPHQFVYDVANLYTASLTVSNASGSSAPFTQQIDAQEEAVSAPTGSLVFISNSSGNLDIFVAEANGSNPVNITNTPFDEVEPVWSPDGTKIAYSSTEFGDYDIFVFDLNTMSSTQITTSGANDRQPAWSPDGSQLAFASDRNNLGVNNDVFVVNVADLGAGTFSPVGLLTSGSDEQEPTWSPDGSQIAFMSDAAGGNNIYVANVADPSTPVQITVSAETANTANEPDWSGNNVIVFSADPDASGNREIYTINPDGSNEVRRTTSGANDRIPLWSPDNSMIYYTSNLATDGSGGLIDLNIWSMNADGSAQAAVTTSGSDEANGNTR